MPDDKNTDKTEKNTGRYFADIAEAVEWGSPEHLSMQHSYLRGLTRQGQAQPAENEPTAPSHPPLDDSDAPERD